MYWHSTHSRIAFVEPENEKISLSQIFRDMRIPSKNIIRINNFSKDSWRKSDVIVLAQGALSQKFLSEEGQKIKNFVKDGGICWIMHQNQCERNSCLPQHLGNVNLENRYSPTDLAPAVKGYICPWILQRDHPIWHKPHYIDESSFVFWEVDIKGKRYRTSATHIITPQHRWNIIAAFTDNKIRLRDKAAVIMEAKYGKGLYFWTQVFSPQVVWNKEKSFEKRAWGLFLENILTYFADYKKGEIPRIRAEVRPWSVMAGKNVKIKIKTNTETKKIILEILKPDGEREKLEGVHPWFSYTPPMGGTYSVKALVTAQNGMKLLTHTFFKATNGFTPFRFLTHVHFNTNWTPESPGYLKGICQRLGIDAVVLAGGLFYTDEERYLRIEENELKAVDTPLVRFFPGEEIHCQHIYGYEKKVEAALGKKGPVAKIRHAITLGCFNLYPYHIDRWHPDNLVKIHNNKGIAIVAHPFSDAWWTKSQTGHNFEGIEFDRTDLSYWDKMLKKGKFVVGISGVDNIASSHLFFPHLASRGPNTGWFDEPFTYQSLIKTVLRGRVTKIAVYPQPVKGRDNYLWFDINNQVTGGTIYAVDRVKLHIKASSHFSLRVMRIVKGGNRLYKKIKINTKSLDRFIEEDVKKDTYYRIEIDSPDRYDKEFAITTLTNPVFVRKIIGPADAYFYFQNDTPPIFDKVEGRWLPNFTQVKEVRFSDRIWEIDLYEPGEKCILCIGGMECCKVKVNGKRKTLHKNKSGEIVVVLNKGNHKIEIDCF